jgi:hypothetical protein
MEVVMPTLQIEHSVRDFAAWKATFDSDPLGREQGGVTSYRIFQPIDDPGYVIVDLEFDNSVEADAFQKALRELWQGVEAEGLIGESRARILEEVESRRY